MFYGANLKLLYCVFLISAFRTLSDASKVSNGWAHCLCRYVEDEERFCSGRRDGEGICMDPIILLL